MSDVWGNNIKFFINKKGITQGELAKSVNMTEISISRYVRGERVPNANALLKIANVLGVKVDDLVKDTNANMKDKNNNIEYYRERKGLTQESLGKMLGVSTSCVGMYETGARVPSYEVLKKLSMSLDVSLDELIFGTKETKQVSYEHVKSLLRDSNLHLTEKEKLDLINLIVSNK